MRFLTAKRIAFGITGLLIILTIAGWFLFGSSLLKLQTRTEITPGSIVENGCQAVYQKVMSESWAGLRIMAEPGFRVEKVLYISGREAKANYNAGNNIQDASHLCYVLIRGNIDVGSPFTTTVTTYSTGSSFYDSDSLLRMDMSAGEHY